MAPGTVYRYSTLKKSNQYTALAPLYDRLMSHVDYSLWKALISRVVHKYLGRKNARIFEIGGGTGCLGDQLSREGFTYTGSDLSFSMCLQASKVRGLPFFCADGQHLPVSNLFDLVIFLYDGINYLKTKESYRDLFTQVNQCLVNNGLFLFDVTTESNSMAHFMDSFDCEDFGDAYYIRHSYYDRLKLLQYNDFTVFLRDHENRNLFSKHNERHAQKVLSVNEIKKRIPSDLFSIEGIWDGFSTKPAHRRSERIHFLLRKKTT